MILCATDIHGALDQFYEDVPAFEDALGVRFAWVLHVDDFHVWLNPDRMQSSGRINS